MSLQDVWIFTPDFECDMAVIDALYHSYGAHSRIGIDILLPIMALPGTSGMMANYYDRATREAVERANQQLAEVEAFCDLQGIDLPLRTTVVSERDIYRTAALWAQCSDLNVIPGTALGTLGGRSGNLLVEMLIFASGRPLLLQPTPARADHRHAAFAWSGKREAVVALAGAVATLPHLARVTLVHIGGELPAMPDGTHMMHAMKSYLCRRVPEVDVYTEPSINFIGDALQDAALAVSADILIMGAYGHCRVRENVLGGATRSILDHPRLPVLLAH
ncbi:universal stress protein [Pacificimonas sp. ICDLI1SI03]